MKSETAQCAHGLMLAGGDVAQFCKGGAVRCDNLMDYICNLSTIYTCVCYMYRCGTICQARSGKKSWTHEFSHLTDFPHLLKTICLFCCPRSASRLLPTQWLLLKLLASPGGRSVRGSFATAPDIISRGPDIISAGHNFSLVFSLCPPFHIFVHCCQTANRSSSY